MDQNDLNLLELTSIPVLLLDTMQNIVFFTSSMRRIYHIIPSDIGRPIDDLKPLVDDASFSQDVSDVLRHGSSFDRPLQTRDGRQLTRRLALRRDEDQDASGVILIYFDVAEIARSHVAEGALTHKRAGDVAGKDRLAEANHDLRQPMQALAILLSMLKRNIQGDRAHSLLTKSDAALAAMHRMLDRLKEDEADEAGLIVAGTATTEMMQAGTIAARPIENGSIHADATAVPLVHVFADMHASIEAGLVGERVKLRMLASERTVLTSRRLIGLLLRNLLAAVLRNAVDGRILVGCRHKASVMQVQIWHAGSRLSDRDVELLAAANARAPEERAHEALADEIGLALSVVRRMASFLGHRVVALLHGAALASFTVEMLCPPAGLAPGEMVSQQARFASRPSRHGTIALIERDDVLRSVLDEALHEEGYTVVTSADGSDFVAPGTQGPRPDLILADHGSLPRRDGGTAAEGAGGEMVWGEIWRLLPVIMLTDDISARQANQFDSFGFIQLRKPVALDELKQIVRRLMPRDAVLSDRRQARRQPAVPISTGGLPMISIVDDDETIRETFSLVFEDAGYHTRQFATGEAFLAEMVADQYQLLLIDAYLPGVSGIDVLNTFKETVRHGAAVMVTGNSDVTMAVRAMKMGAFDFIEKPVQAEELLRHAARAVAHLNDARPSHLQTSVSEAIARLTRREREILQMVLEGKPSKRIAADLGISKRTVENHRAAIMKKTGSTSLPALARLAFALPDAYSNGGSAESGG